MSISFHILADNEQSICLMARKIKSYFNISYYRGGEDMWTFIDNDDNYIIKLSTKSLRFIIVDNPEEQMNGIVDKCIGFINSNYNGSTLGFNQTTGKIIPINKFKDIKIINLTKYEVNETPYWNDGTPISVDEQMKLHLKNGEILIGIFKSSNTEHLILYRENIELEIKSDQIVKIEKESSEKEG